MLINYFIQKQEAVETVQPPEKKEEMIKVTSATATGNWW